MYFIMLSDIVMPLHFYTEINIFYCKLLSVDFSFIFQLGHYIDFLKNYVHR